MPNSANRAIIVCGPTASGKTEFAHFVALQNDGEVVNADSMQIYKQLPIITASPHVKLQQEIPYYLYNFQDVDQEFSAIKYINAASSIIKQISSRKKLPVIVGGSGMYISMLINGYSEIPDIDDDIRSSARALHKNIGADKFFRELQKLDPEIVKILNVGDTQRVVRAYEIFQQTGKSILRFQELDNVVPLPNFVFQILFLLPSRSFLYESCNTRLIKLFDAGAIEEVRKIYKDYGDLSTSATKSLGVSEIISYIKDEITLPRAIELASAKTRQYAKRQTTWFKNQLSDTKIFEFSSIEEYKKIVSEFKLTT